MVVKGRFDGAGPIQYVGENGSFKKRFFRLDIGSDGRANYAKMLLTGDKVNLVDSLKHKDELEVSFFINGRIWQKDHQTEEVIQDLQVVGITLIRKEAIGGGSEYPYASEAVSSKVGSAANGVESSSTAAVVTAGIAGNDDDLPF